MYCDTVAGDYGVCAPCPGLLNDCAVDTTTSGTGPGSTGSGGGTCSHDTCTSRTALDGTCDACAASVCANDSYCCTNAWDSQCIGEVQTYCNNDCGTTTATGSTTSTGSGTTTGGGNPSCHDQCSQGAALDATCNSCVQMVCAQDSYCCNTAWDSVCIGHVNSLCNPTCF